LSIDINLNEQSWGSFFELLHAAGKLGVGHNAAGVFDFDFSLTDGVVDNVFAGTLERGWELTAASPDVVGYDFNCARAEVIELGLRCLFASLEMGGILLSLGVVDIGRELADLSNHNTVV